MATFRVELAVVGLEAHRVGARLCGRVLDLRCRRVVADDLDGALRGRLRDRQVQVVVVLVEAAAESHRVAHGHVHVVGIAAWGLVARRDVVRGDGLHLRLVRAVVGLEREAVRAGLVGGVEHLREGGVVAHHAHRPLRRRLRDLHVQVAVLVVEAVAGEGLHPTSKSPLYSKHTGGSFTAGTLLMFTVTSVEFDVPSLARNLTTSAPPRSRCSGRRSSEVPLPRIWIVPLVGSWVMVRIEVVVLVVETAADGVLLPDLEPGVAEAEAARRVVHRGRVGHDHGDLFRVRVAVVGLELEGVLALLRRRVAHQRVRRVVEVDRHGALRGRLRDRDVHVVVLVVEALADEEGVAHLDRLALAEARGRVVDGDDVVGRDGDLRGVRGAVVRLELERVGAGAAAPCRRSSGTSCRCPRS